MPFRNNFRRSRKRAQRGASTTGSGKNGDNSRFSSSRHGHHSREPNVTKMLIYFCIIVLNFWYQYHRKHKDDVMVEDDVLSEITNNYDNDDIDPAGSEL